MEKKRENLEKELDKIEIPEDESLNMALNEILYMADETGIIGFRIDDEDAIIIHKLFLIADKYKNKFPDKLRM
jgi:hypothetical protein